MILDPQISLNTSKTLIGLDKFILNGKISFLEIKNQK
jgi:hypothetical protein